MAPRKACCFHPRGCSNVSARISKGFVAMQSLLFWFYPCGLSCCDLYFCHCYFFLLKLHLTSSSRACCLVPSLLQLRVDLSLFVFIVCCLFFLLSLPQTTLSCTNCVTQLKLDTVEKLSSTIFCCL